jgi:hypothetical protein
MRIIGYIFLVVGFLWIALWCDFSIGALTREIGKENIKKHPVSKTYSWGDVEEAIRTALIEYDDNAPRGKWPAILMLLGGICIDLSKKKSSDNNKKNYETDA